MFLSGPPKSGKTQRLIDVYIDLINKNTQPDNILVICSNAYKKQQFIQSIKQKLNGGYSGFRIHTYNGVVYNTINNFWPLIEKHLNGEPEILPYLTGLETCEFILKECIKEQNSKNNESLIFEEFYGDRSLVTQLIRRYRLMCENLLTFDEILRRSKNIGQKYALQSNECLKCLKLKTSQLRILDFATQISAFNLLISKESQVINYFKKIKHLIVDDYDETIPATQHFIKFLLPNVESFSIALDKLGGTKRGYQSAYPHGWQELDLINKGNLIELESNANLSSVADKLFFSIKKNTPTPLSNIDLRTCVNRMDMFDELKLILNDLLFLKETNIEDIVIVIPNFDNTIKSIIEGYCCKNQIRFQFLTGSSKPINNPRIYGMLIIAQLINVDWKYFPNSFDIRIMLSGALNFPPIIAEKIAEKYINLNNKAKDKVLLPDIQPDEIKEEFLSAYYHLKQIIQNINNEKISLAEQLITIFSEIIAPNLTENESVSDFNAVLSSLNDFIYLMKRYKDKFNVSLAEKHWFLQVKNEYVAENPGSPSAVEENSLIIATPQKIVDIGLTSKYQIWLDVSSSSWVRTQTAALYNAWAFSKYYNNSDYSDERFTHSIAAHVLRGLIYYCSERIIALASNLDSTGYEQQGWLINFLGKTTEKYTPKEKPVLRDDQQPIINYNGGSMAVAAVPGSGKTFVNVALIVKLIESGINPENILVLTYMESAAQTLIHRIKSIFPEMKNLPQISTIHGLAYKLIRDDDNLSLLNLSPDIDVIDDSIKHIIMNHITSLTLPEGEEVDKWKKYLSDAIYLAKSYNIKPYDIYKYLNNNESYVLDEFNKAYNLYNKELKHRCLLDFDDQIRYAIELLSLHQTVKENYQQKYQYIIEDEAQDSTILQQQLLSLLVEKHKNFVRTGDINQAIMTTFTPVDIEGFKNFINNANTTVIMNKSQRCSKPIYTFANNLIDWARSQPGLKNSFLNIKIEPAGNLNPDINEPVHIEIFENSDDELEFITNKLNELKAIMPLGTFAILVRSNKIAVEVTNYLDSKGFNCICYTENIQQIKVFNIIYNYLQVLHKPYNNNLIRNLYESLLTSNLIQNDQQSYEFLMNLGSPFISFNLSELPTTPLAQLSMDILYWLEFSNLPTTELITKFSQELFTDPIDRSNGFILSIIAEKYRKTQTDIRYRESFNEIMGDQKNINQFKTTVGLPEIIQLFSNLIKLNKVKGFKFFEKDDNDSTKAGFIQIMTIHKAKGMGFDGVFIPYIWESPYSYPTKTENINPGTLNKLEWHMLKMTGKAIEQDIFEQNNKQKQLDETLRLLYVAITRAKKYLFLTSSNVQSNKYKTKLYPSRILEHFIPYK